MRDDKLIEEMRESFEAWFSDWQHSSAVERDTVGYKLAKAQNALVWQAAWQAALAALSNGPESKRDELGDAPRSVRPARRTRQHTPDRRCRAVEGEQQ